MKRTLVMLGVAVMLAGCVTVAPDEEDPADPPGDCANLGTGNPNKGNPEVCISVYADAKGFGGLLVNPMVAVATRRAPAVVKWRTRSAGEDIAIEMKDADCTTPANMTCRGRGTCTIPIKPNPAGGEECRYLVTVTLSTGQILTLDPIVKIDTD